MPFPGNVSPQCRTQTISDLGNRVAQARVVARQKISSKNLVSQRWSGSQSQTVSIMSDPRKSKSNRWRQRPSSPKWLGFRSKFPKANSIAKSYLISNRWGRSTTRCNELLGDVLPHFDEIQRRWKMKRDGSLFQRCACWEVSRRSDDCVQCAAPSKWRSSLNLPEASPSLIVWPLWGHWATSGATKYTRNSHKVVKIGTIPYWWHGGSYIYVYR